MAQFNISNFRAQGLRGGGARPTLFKVQLFAPFASPTTQRTELLITATDIPASTIEPIPVFYFGRSINEQGDRSFQPWNVTILNDTDFAIRAMLENWHNKMNTIVSNVLDPSLAPNNFKADSIVTQFDREGNPIRAYKYAGAWPMQIGPIRLDWSAQNQIEVYDVTMAVDWWEPEVQGETDVYAPTTGADGIGS